MRDSTTSREKVLKKIRAALIQKSVRDLADVDKDSNVFVPSEEPLEIQFAQNFSALNGKFVFCENEKEFLENFDFIAKDHAWKNIFCLEPSIKNLLKKGGISFLDKETDFLSTEIGITLCECLVARTGSIVITSKQASGRRLPAFANYHIVIAYTSQLVYGIKDSLKFVRDKYNGQIPSMISTISGPSRTSDIEKTLIQGAHGPKEIFVFLIDDIPVMD
ncbi:MAG: LUD domain-containing protein [Bacteroidia bacterium]